MTVRAVRQLGDPVLRMAANAVADLPAWWQVDHRCQRPSITGGIDDHRPGDRRATGSVLQRVGLVLASRGH
ncbi:MAG: hypothetical protein R2839_13095 [Thermomicrobiales bacterium]